MSSHTQILFFKVESCFTDQAAPELASNSPASASQMLGL